VLSIVGSAAPAGAAAPAAGGAAPAAEAAPAKAAEPEEESDDVRLDVLLLPKAGQHKGLFARMCVFVDETRSSFILSPRSLLLIP
jgi:hypothetical protein